MAPTDWSIHFVTGDHIERSQFRGAEVHLHITDHGAMVRTYYPTTETTYPWHAIREIKQTS